MITSGICQSPLVYGHLLPHVWLVGSASTLLFLVDAAALLGVTIAVMLRQASCRPAMASRRTAAGVLPAFVGVSGCCGAPVAAALGTSAVGLLLRVTPWLLATMGVLTIHLRLMRAREHDQTSVAAARL